MFARVEIAMRPDYSDPAAEALLRRIELAHPEARKRIRWARLVDVYLLDLPASREELIPSISKIFWDHVLQWMFSGNLVPSAAGKSGGLQDLMETAPNRPGQFFGLERRFRPGVTDNTGRTVIEAFEIVLGRSLADARASSGSLLLLEGAELDETVLAQIAQDVFCNELIESWMMCSEDELKKNDRFHQERVKRDIPKVTLRAQTTRGSGLELRRMSLGGAAESQAGASLPAPQMRLSAEDLKAFALAKLPDDELLELSRRGLWALSLEEMRAIQKHFADPATIALREKNGAPMPTSVTDVEIEILAQTWSEHCKHKIFGATIDYEEVSARSGAADLPVVPKRVESLFKTTIAATTAELKRPWLLSVFHDNAGIVAFDDEDAFCIKVETHNSPSALDPYGGALTGIVGVNRDILGCGLGAKPIFNTDVFCVAPLDYVEPLPERLLHPRRILDGVRRGVEAGGNHSGIPNVNGALVFDERYLGKPLVYCGTGGFLPRMIAGRPCETKEVRPGDRIFMVGGRIGKDGIHGATFSSLALDEASPVSAVQLGDPITQKRMADFLLEARDRGLYRALTDNGAGGLSSSVGEMARLSGGADIDVSLAKTKYPGLKPYELVVSESQERMTVAVPPESIRSFMELAALRGVEVSDLGSFTEDGYFRVRYQGNVVGLLSLEFLHEGAPKLQLKGRWKAPQPPTGAPLGKSGDFAQEGAEALLSLLGSPNIASKEWLIRQYDHEVQGQSVIKQLHVSQTGALEQECGPNDGAVLKPKARSEAGLVVGCGICPRYSDWDPLVMAQMAVDEAIRNVIAVGAEYGRPESIVSLVDNFCWPDPVGDEQLTAALVRACFGLRDAALGLRVPLVSGKDSMKNDYKGRVGAKDIKISVPPTLLMTAVAKMSDVRFARSSDFKSEGDRIYLIGDRDFSLLGSEMSRVMPSVCEGRMSALPRAKWELARKIYSSLGAPPLDKQPKIRSVHDVSDGGVLVAVAESLIARGFGASVRLSGDPWSQCFGEGFHHFVVTVTEDDSEAFEAIWDRQGVPFTHIGETNRRGKLEVQTEAGGFTVGVESLRKAWKKAGYWE